MRIQVNCKLGHWQDLLDTAVDKWFSIIRVNLLASAAGREIIGHGSIQEQKAGAYETIEAIIGIRSRTSGGVLQRRRTTASQSLKRMHGCI